MGRPRKFKGLSEVAALTDGQARDLVLGSWATLNGVLMTRPPAAQLRRLLLLEYNGGARADLLVRLRQALSRAAGREALAALREALGQPREGVPPELLEAALR